MLLRTDRAGTYRGVDREPFEPLIDEDAQDPHSLSTDAVSDFYPSGWKRSLYRLAESDQVNHHGFLFSRLTTAVALQQQLAAHVGSYEIVWAEIGQLLGSAEDLDRQLPREFIGYDLAYLGGDFYSAILNGMFVNPHPDLRDTFGARLNAFGLFSRRDDAAEYVEAFRRAVTSEASSEFLLYELRSVSGKEAASASRSN